MSKQPQPRASSGVPGLDQVLRGGFPRGHLYLVTGPSGAGKTTLAMEFLMEGARQNERVLYLGTAETASEIDIVAQSHGWDLSGIEIRHYGGPEDSVRGPEQTMLYATEVELPRTMERLMSLVEEIKPQRLVIDSLSEIRLLSREESWFREQVKILQRHVAGWDCTVLVTDLFVEDQPALRSGVHGVIELKQKDSVYGPDRRALRVAKMRGVDHVMGHHDFTIETGGARVYPRLVAAEHRQRRELEMISSGLPELDQLLCGGIGRGSATMLLGPTGTGKSSLATQYVVAAARRGEKSAMYIFDERVQTVFERAAGLGLELEEHVDAGLIAVRQIDPVELTPGQFSQAVVDAVDDGVRMVVMDSLNGYAYAMPEERLLALYLHELLSYLAHKGVTSILVMTEHGLTTPQAPHFDVSYIADTLIVMRPFEFRGKVRNAIAVHKRRVGPHERTVREFDLSEGKVVIGRALDEFSGILSGKLNFHGATLERPQDEA